MIATRCRHCGNANATRPRGLCWRCYYTPGVKELYPSTSKFGVWGNGIAEGRAPAALGGHAGDVALAGAPAGRGRRGGRGAGGVLGPAGLRAVLSWKKLAPGDWIVTRADGVIEWWSDRRMRGE